jgi:hypothetical protein
MSFNRKSRYSGDLKSAGVLGLEGGRFSITRIKELESIRLGQSPNLGNISARGKGGCGTGRASLSREREFSTETRTTQCRRWSILRVQSN